MHIKKLIFKSIIATMLFVIPLQSTTMIEVFDIEKGKVINEIKPNENIQEEISLFINSINGIYSHINPIPKKGLMVKIPLEPTIKVENKWFNHLIGEIIMMIPDHECPYLLMFDDENRSYFFVFSSDIDHMFEYLKLSSIHYDMKQCK